MNSQPLRRSALAMLMGMALLTAGCAAETTPDPDATGIPSTSATASTSPTPSASTAEAAPGTPAPAPTATTGSPAEPAPGDGECATADAGAASGTYDDPYAVGDEITVGCFTVVVTDVTLDATDAVQNYNADAAPASGHAFSVVMVMIARTGGEPADVSDVEVRLASSRTASVAADPDLRLEEQAPPTGSLSPGQATGGTLVFETPNAGTPRVLLRLATGGEVWVAP